jgi:hypothetical protein
MFARGSVMKKRIISILMTMLMAIAMMPTGTWTTYAANVYEISSYEELKDFANMVNGTGEYASNPRPDISGKLTANIECTGGDWTPIGNDSSPYTGTFDGDGHVINNLSNEYASTNSSYQGLFGFIGSGGKVSNVGLTNGTIRGVRYVGGVVGYSEGTITNCYNTGTVSGLNYVGGVVGDNTGNGKEFEYDVLAELLSTYRKSSSPIYYTIGNHDYMYYDTIEEGLDLFKKRLGMKNHYYSVEIKGIKFIILGSDTTSGYGSLSEAQLNWLENELKTAASNKPIFIMIHQPLKNTVAGTLDKLDPNQTSAGFIDSSGTKLRKILKSYPNSFVFTGHSHWTMDSYQSTYVGVGHDANFINCSSVAAPEDGSGRLAGSQGVFVEVYEDFVVIKGRDFVKNAWISSNQIVMKLEKEEQQ